MKTHSTDQLLTLGMALTTDKKAMERRVRGVFARKTSAKSVIALSLALALVLGFAAFTTACQPVQPDVSDSNAQLASGGNAVVSGGDAAAIAAKTTSQKEEYTKEEAMKWLRFMLDEARMFPAPRIEGISFTERGKCSTLENTDDATQLRAANRFLETANAIFSTKYVSSDLMATYYTDQTGHRADVWRFDSKDGLLSGALEAKTLAFLSADCYSNPGDALHPSLVNPGKDAKRSDFWGTLDLTAAAERIANIFGGAVHDWKDAGGSGRENATAGWMIQPQMLFQLDDGRYCAIIVFADEALTPTTVCVYPDYDCAEESVFWRADIEANPNVVQLLKPEDFREGKPTAQDMTREDAIAFFYKFFAVAGSEDFAAGEHPPEPTTTFYVDNSGARENYWHMVGNGVTIELASRTGRMLRLTTNGRVGTTLGLDAIPGEKMGEKEYEDATTAFYTELFGENAVESVSLCNKDNNLTCTMDLNLTDGTLHEVTFINGRVTADAVSFRLDPSTWASVPAWLEKWASVDGTTGKISIPGFDHCDWMITPKWLANGVYIHNETGEIFAREG